MKLHKASCYCRLPYFTTLPSLKCFCLKWFEFAADWTATSSLNTDKTSEAAIFKHASLTTSLDWVNEINCSKLAAAEPAAVVYSYLVIGVFNLSKFDKNSFLTAFGRWRKVKFSQDFLLMIESAPQAIFYEPQFKLQIQTWFDFIVKIPLNQLIWSQK